MLEITQVPTFPPFSEDPLVQVPVTAFGLGVAVVGSGVYEYEQVHIETVVVVLPPTVAVNDCTCPAMTTVADGLTVTVMTLGPEPLHPFSNRIAPHTIPIAAD